MQHVDEINRRTLRLPQDAATFLADAAKRNFTSENAEIVRSIRERALREGEKTTAGEASKGQSLPSPEQNAAFQGGVPSPRL